MSYSWSEHLTSCWSQLLQLRHIQVLKYKIKKIFVAFCFSTCRCIKPQLKSLALGFHALATRTLGKGLLGLACMFLWILWTFLTSSTTPSLGGPESFLYVYVFGRSGDPSAHLLWSDHWHHVSKMGSEEVWGYRSLSDLQHHSVQVALTLKPNLGLLQSEFIWTLILTIMDLPF